MGWTRVSGLLNLISWMPYKSRYGHVPMHSFGGQRASYTCCDDSEHRGYSKCSTQDVCGRSKAAESFAARTWLWCLRRLCATWPFIAGILFTLAKGIVESLRLSSSMPSVFVVRRSRCISRRRGMQEGDGRGKSVHHVTVQSTCQARLAQPLR